MQTQTQIPGQVPGQVLGQVSRIPQQNGSSLTLTSTSIGGSSWRKTWQTDADVALRRTVVDNILQLFQTRRGPVTPEWQQKLPDFVKRLEEALYRNAATKEEYADQHTLENRLQSVAKRMTRVTQSSAQHGSQVVQSSSLGNMMPTPGVASTMISTSGNTGNMIPMPQSGVSSMMLGGASTMVPTPGSLNSMMPTPGHAGNMMSSISTLMPTAGNGSNIMPPGGNGSSLMSTTGPSATMFANAGGNMMPTPGTNGNALVSQSGMSSMRVTQNGNSVSSMGIPSVGSQMISTPGLSSTQAMSVNQASSPGLGIPSSGANSSGQLQPHQQAFPGSTAHMYRNMNGQIPVPLNNIVQRKGSLGAANGGMSNGMPMLANSQHLINANTMHTASGYLSPNQFNNLQVQNQQQRANQQQRTHLRMQPNISNSMSSLVSDGYAMNAADLAGTGTLYPPVSSGGIGASSLNIGAVGSQPPKMIPVPGLPSTQQNTQHLQASQTQQMSHIHRSNFQPNSSVSRAQQQQSVQIPKSQGLYQSGQSPIVSSQKQQPANSIQEQTQLQAMTQKISVPMGRPLYETQPSSPQLQRQQPVTVQQQSTQQHILLQQQPQHQRQAVIPQQKNLSHPQVRQAPQVQQKQPDECQQQPQQPSFQQQQQLKSVPQTPVQQPRPQQQGQQQNSGASHPQQQKQLPQESMSLEQEQHQDQEQDQDDQQQQQKQSPTMPQASSQQSGQQVQRQLAVNGSATQMQTTGLPGGNVAGPPTSGPPSSGPIDPQRAQQYSKQQRWLLFLRHASNCTSAEGQCSISPHCHMARNLWTHLGSCRERECQYVRCNASRTLLHHYRHCCDAGCPVCGPVKLMISQKRPKASQSLQMHGAAAAPPLGVVNNSTTSSMVGPALGSSVSTLPDIEVHAPPSKRAKIERVAAIAQSNLQGPQQSIIPGPAKVPSPSQSQVPGQPVAPRPLLPIKSELLPAVKVEAASPAPALPKMDTQIVIPPVGQRQGQVKLEALNQIKAEVGHGQGHPVKAEFSGGGPPAVKQEQVTAVAPAAGSVLSTAKSAKQKVIGTSLTELFTPEQIKEHITGLRQWVGQSKAKAEKNQAMEHQMSDNACRLCAVEKLTFEPPPIYCTACGARIKRNALYYTVGSGETRHYFCIPCYNDIRTETVEMDAMTYPKAKLEKRKNDEETEEAWVQCDKCNLWNHQVCALFNGRRNEGGEAEYTCPQCCMAEIERGERKPLQSSAVLGAKDLPKTFLSDHLEQRLARKLKQEKTERAKVMGKGIDEIPGAEALVVRVVSSVDKKLEVKQHFMEIFQEEDYPTEFPYKSKVVLLFQKIEGVEVCLFGMYVQEFGVECSHPNQRRVYLSYLDSVKYFRPDVKTVYGEALRTFVYHEILIGYLDYCKKRGFSSCYIWACPPLKGEDYILYCHPEIQKTPKSDKLRDWYLAMLRKATSDNIVVEVTNLYDYFFVQTGECKAKVTAARLPYFDGDYWPGAAEDMIVQLQQEEEDGRKLQKKGKNKKTATKRASKSAAQAEMASNASKDLQLMYKLGESILPMKEDFIMVHMHHACTHCRQFIVSGHRWVCKLCKNFQLCDWCYGEEQKREERDRHPISIKEAHLLIAVDVNDVPQDTKDKDEFMESEFFDTRQAFLSLCQGNHYQYDTLRRAKHSSMMVLYHLHNPTAPAFVITCNACHRDIETGQGWRCETCPDFDLCNTCKDSSKHQHKLTPHPSASERNAQNKEARQQRVLQLRKMLDLLVHASQCGAPQCQYPKCRSVKGLFRHGMMCKTRASGGCGLCKRMWYLLQLHARACKESECRVPRCKDLKEHVRRSNQQQESRRRAAVMEMMRQRAAEAANGIS